MKGESKERWVELCERAVNEHDHVKFYELNVEINRLLGEKFDRLKRSRPVISKSGTNR